MALIKGLAGFLPEILLNYSYHIFPQLVNLMHLYPRKTFQPWNEGKEPTYQ